MDSQLARECGESVTAGGVDWVVGSPSWSVPALQDGLLTSTLHYAGYFATRLREIYLAVVVVLLAKVNPA